VLSKRVRSSAVACAHGTMPQDSSPTGHCCTAVLAAHSGRLSTKLCNIVLNIIKVLAGQQQCTTQVTRHWCWCWCCCCCLCVAANAAACKQQCCAAVHVERFALKQCRSSHQLLCHALVVCVGTSACCLAPGAIGGTWQSATHAYFIHPTIHHCKDQTLRGAPT
jgi:hypothetical protein